MYIQNRRDSSKFKGIWFVSKFVNNRNICDLKPPTFHMITVVNNLKNRTNLMFLPIIGKFGETLNNEKYIRFTR